MVPSSCPRADHQGLEARYSGLAVPAGLGLGEVRGVKDMVLDPVCGSGTTAVVAARLGGRFIVIDRELAAIATTPHRLLALQESGDYRKTRKADGTPPAINVLDFAACDGPLTITDTWNNADPLVVHGDAHRSSRPCRTASSPWSTPTTSAPAVLTVRRWNFPML